jgi:hypothetical protein
MTTALPSRIKAVHRKTFNNITFVIRCSGEAPVDIEAFHQMRVGVERVRVPELLFQVCPYNTIHLDVHTYLRHSFFPWQICGLHKINGLYVSFAGIFTPQQ